MFVLCVVLGGRSPPVIPQIVGLKTFPARAVMKSLTVNASHDRKYACKTIEIDNDVGDRSETKLLYLRFVPTCSVN